MRVVNISSSETSESCGFVKGRSFRWLVVIENMPQGSEKEELKRKACIRPKPASLYAKLVSVPSQRTYHPSKYPRLCAVGEIKSVNNLETSKVDIVIANKVCDDEFARATATNQATSL